MTLKLVKFSSCAILEAFNQYFQRSFNHNSAVAFQSCFNAECLLADVDIRFEVARKFIKGFLDKRSEDSILPY